MSKLLLTLLLVTILSLGLLPPLAAQAESLRDNIFSFYNSFADKASLPKTFSLEGVSPASRITNILKLVLGLLGTIFVILVVYGGILWMTAGGNEEQLKKAQGVIKNAVIGLTIVLGAYAITWFVGTYIIESFI